VLNQYRLSLGPKKYFQELESMKKDEKFAIFLRYVVKVFKGIGVALTYFVY